jgi:23S rRNA (guanine745-N1)-methyltransferase
LPSAVPPPLARVAERLQCPLCSEPLAPSVGALACARGHRYDIARHGYVTLLAPDVRPATGDDAGMVASRAAVEAAGHLEPLTASIVDAAGAAASGDESLVLDVGAGTGHHLAAVLRALPKAKGVALDVSRAASRRAARAHDSAAAVRCDVWSQIPLGHSTVDLALGVFAPRNGAELARVVRPGGTVVVVTPTSRHLHELRTLHTISVDPDKVVRLRRQLSPWFELTRVRPINWTLRLTRHQAAAVVRMGPAARHLTPDFDDRVAAMCEPVLVTAAVQLRVFHRCT